MTSPVVVPPRVVRAYRRALLPRWARVLCWLMLVNGAICALAFLAYPFVTGPLSFHDSSWSFSILPAPAGPTSLTDSIADWLLIISGVAAFGLLRGHSWAVTLGLVAGSAGVLSSVLSLAIDLSDGSAVLGLSPFLQLVFVVAIAPHRAAWHNVRLHKAAA